MVVTMVTCTTVAMSTDGSSYLVICTIATMDICITVAVGISIIVVIWSFVPQLLCAFNHSCYLVICTINTVGISTIVVIWSFVAYLVTDRQTQVNLRFADPSLSV